MALARHFFERHRDEAGRPLRGLSADAIQAIARYPWPGNVRELENKMKWAIVLAEGPRLTLADLDLPTESAERPTPTLRDAVREAERRVVAKAWTEVGGNVSHISRLLGVSRPTAYKLLRDHGYLKG